MNFKSIGCFLLAWFVIINSPSAAAETKKVLQFAGQWPYHSSKALATDADRNLVFLSDGNVIAILTTDLEYITTIAATESCQLGGLLYSETDQLLYAACRDEGLKVFDLSRPENPEIIFSWQLPDVLEILSLRVSGTTAYICCGIDGLVIADLSDFKSPKILSKSGLPGGYGLSYAIDIHVTGNYAFAADLYNGIHVLEITDSQNPDYLKGIALAGASDLDASGNWLYAALQGSGTAILDIRVPKDTAVTALFSADGIESAVRIVPDFAWIAYNPGGLRGVNTDDKTAPFHDASWTYQTGGGSSLSLISEKNTLFMADYISGLTKFNINQDNIPAPVTSFDTPADAVAIDITGGYIYAVDNTMGGQPEKEGLRIHAITATKKYAQFQYTGFCPTPGTALDIQVIPDYAYIADGKHGLQIISVQDPAQPEIVGTFDTPGIAESLFIEKNYAFIADGEYGLTVIDIKNPTAPVLSGSIEMNGNARHIAVAENYAFVAAGNEGIHIINISTKSTPALMTTIDTQGEASGIFITDAYAYVADGSKGLSILDISQPLQPELLATLNTAGNAQKVMVSGNFAYVADGENGLCVIDIFHPAAPVNISEWHYDSSGIASDVFSGFSNEDEELYAFIADGAAGVIGINLSTEKIIDEDGDDGGSSSSGGCFIGRLKS